MKAKFKLTDKIDRWLFKRQLRKIKKSGFMEQIKKFIAEKESEQK